MTFFPLFFSYFAGLKIIFMLYFVIFPFWTAPNRSPNIDTKFSL